MKLSRLYTNRPKLFTPIDFHDGLNVVLAEVKHPKDPEKHSHCLGKSLLIDIIDFGLLKGIDKTHFFKKRSDLFDEFEFYLEIRTHNGQYVTIKRSVLEPTKINFIKHNEALQDFSDLPDKKWDHSRVPIEKATLILDSYVDLTAIKPYSYRKGVSYFLRSQRDYLDVFQLTKYGHGKHVEWKPYLAKVIGLDNELISNKYKIDEKIDMLESKQRELQADAAIKPSEFEKLKASITVKRDEVETKAKSLEQFEFSIQEIELVKETAEAVETEISEVNSQLYNARYDLSQIERGLRDKIKFDLQEVIKIFEEAKLTFPKELAKDYESLVKFNQQILKERREHLTERASELKALIASLENANRDLAQKRQNALKIFSGSDSLQKFKELQGQLDKDRANLAIMEEKAEKLNAVLALNQNIRSAKAEKDLLSGIIEKLVVEAQEQISRYRQIGINFSRIIKDVLRRTAVFYIEQNAEGNIEFNTEFTDSDSAAPTEEHRGNTFNQLLCIAFDLAVLIAYAKDPFFHFVYHDGGLEQKQSKVKLALLRVIRNSCDVHGIQYLLSALDEDIPRTDDKEGLSPSPSEVVLQLHDGGDSGRLFKFTRF